MLTQEQKQQLFNKAVRRSSAFTRCAVRARPPMTREAMFRRAWEGLKSQGFKKCMSNDVCVYREGNYRCAWGWVDPEGTAHNPVGSVVNLRECGVGLAAQLSDSDLEFARRLQRAHDGAKDPEDMKNLLKAMAVLEGFQVPD